MLRKNISLPEWTECEFLDPVMKEENFGFPKKSATHSLHHPRHVLGDSASCPHVTRVQHGGLISVCHSSWA